MIATFPTRSFRRPFPAPAVGSFDRAFAQLAALTATPTYRDVTAGRVAAGPDLRGQWVDGAYQLTVDLPGVPEHAVAVSVAGRTLTLDVATDTASWSRQLRLPQTLDPEQVSARYVDGRLTVTVAKTAAPESRRIAVDTTPAQPELQPVAETVQAAANGEGTNVTE